MPKKARPATARMQQVHKRIEEWRRTRPCRTAMPAALWSEAASLARSEGAYRVARALRVNLDGLRRRMAEAAVETAPAFVELPAGQLLGAPQTAGAVVEMQDSDGTRVVVRLGAGAPVDVAQVVSAFRRRGA